MDAYRKHSDLLKAMAHPVRLRILDVLSQGEACVCHLTTVLDQRQPYISQQLMLLRESRLVLDRREGTIVYYRLADRAIADVIALTRALLRAQGIDATLPPASMPPVKGCPCPKCNEG